MSLRGEVHRLCDRFFALSEYDRSQFEQSDIEGLLKCRTQVDNLYLAVWISSGCGVAAAAAVVFIIINIKRRKKKKALKYMAESDE